MKKLTYKHTLLASYLGYITQAIAVNLSPVFFIVFQTKYGISFEELGRLIFIFFVAQIIVDLLAVKYVDRIGQRLCAVVAHVFSAVGLVSMAFLPQIMPPYIGLVTATLIIAVGSGMIEVLVSPIVDALPGDAKASAMSLLHSFYCWGQLGTILITTLLLKVIGRELWYIIPILWAIIPFINIFSFMKVPLAPPVPEERKMSVKQLLSSRVFIIVLILMTCSGAAEQAMAQWASLFAENGLKITKVAGDLLGPCMFALLMGIGRTIYGIWGEKFNLSRTMMYSGALCIVCYLVATLSSLPAVSMIGCAVCGFSVSIMWPGMLSLSSSRCPNGGTAMFGMCAMFGDLGCSLGPWITGIVADSKGLNMGLLTAIVFPVIMIIGILLMNVNIKNKNNS